MSCQVKHWIYINEMKVETVKVKYIEPKKVEQPVHAQPMWLRWFFMKRISFRIERPVEVWEEAFPWP